MIIDENIQLLEVQKLATSSVETKYLIYYKDRYFESSSAVADLITALKECSSISEAALCFSKVRGKTYSIEDLNILIDKYIIPIFKSIETKPLQPLLLNYELINADDVSRFSKVLKYLFRPMVAITLMLIATVLGVMFFTQVSYDINIGQLDFYLILGVLGLYILFSAFHEFGHAAACQFMGVQHGGIGFGLYLYIPVFYTDVSRVWNLSRGKRIIVNVAGIYFQLIFLIPLFILCFLTYNAVLQYFILTLSLNMLITLNPFFKFDGYWIISDILGVPNLRQRSNELFGYWYNLLRGHTVQQPFLLCIKKREKIFALIYAVIVNIFFALFICYFIPRFALEFFDSFPSTLKEVITELSLGNIPSFEMIQRILMQLLFFFIATFTLFRIFILPILRFLKNNRIRLKNNNPNKK